MPPDKTNRQIEFTNRYWNFLAYLLKYTEEAKELAKNPTDPGRTRLLTLLTERMRPVLEADVAFVAFREDNARQDRLTVDKQTVSLKSWEIQDSPLIKYLRRVAWKLPAREVTNCLPDDIPVMILDPKRLPRFIQDKAKALALAHLTLLGKEYFLFFCDTKTHTGKSPRYDNFHRVMLQVVTGLLEVGFQTGARTSISGIVESSKTADNLDQSVDQIRSALTASLNLPPVTARITTEIEPLAFLSYAHDNNEDGQLTEFCDLLSKEVSGLIGEKFHIFMDINDIKWGNKWRERLDKGLAQAIFLIPIISPTYFNRPECRNELQKFNEKILSQGRNDLILPIYFIDVPQLNRNPNQIRDPLVRLIADTQREDWRDLRLKKFSYSTKFKRLNKLAIQIQKALSV